jgi:hypothetical protein
MGLCWCCAPVHAVIVDECNPRCHCDKRRETTAVVHHLHFTWSAIHHSAAATLQDNGAAHAFQHIAPLYLVHPASIPDQIHPTSAFRQLSDHLISNTNNVLGCCCKRPTPTTQSNSMIQSSHKLMRYVLNAACNQCSGRLCSMCMP